MFSAAGLNSAGSTRLLTNGARSAICAAAVARRRRERREVAGQHRRRRHVGDVRGRRHARHGALVAAKEKQAVPGDRPADRAAELVAPQPVADAFAVGAANRKRVRRVEPVVAQELERVAVEHVGSRLGHGVHRRARVHAVLRRQAARRHAELLHRIRERQRQAAGVLRVVVHGAVEDVGDAGVHAARDRDADTALKILRVGPAGDEGGARQHDEVGHLASLERQRHDPLLLDDRADAGAPHVDDGRRGFDRHGLFQVPDRPAAH